MKLILMSTPDFFVEEDQIFTALFEEGLDILHLRKPNSEPVYSERLLHLIPEQYHNRIIVHDHFYLKEEYGLKGINLSNRNPEKPVGYKGMVSRSCYSLQDLQQYRKQYDYLLLSRIFPSLSERNNPSTFTEEELYSAARQGTIDRKVMALGGISLERIPKVREYGFGGIVIRGDIWNNFVRHSHTDFKDLINHFHLLRKACE